MANFIRILFETAVEETMLMVAEQPSNGKLTAIYGHTANKPERQLEMKTHMKMERVSHTE